MDLKLMAPCHFGLEAVTKREIINLSPTIKIDRVEDGRIFYTGCASDLIRSNIMLRTPERVLVVIGEFCAKDFEDLYQGVLALPWEDYLPVDAKFWVKKAAAVKSRVYSPRDIQAIAKKAIVERLKRTYHKEHFPETGDEYPIRIFVKKDLVTIALDSSGTSLHKRGYRKEAGEAPISETLAAALVMLTPFNDKRILCDPFCGSGTIAIEAAMLAKNIAPGANRHFTIMIRGYFQLFPPWE